MLIWCWEFQRIPWVCIFCCLLLVGLLFEEAFSSGANFYRVIAKPSPSPPFPCTGKKSVVPWQSIGPLIQQLVFCCAGFNRLNKHKPSDSQEVKCVVASKPHCFYNCSLLLYAEWEGKTQVRDWLVSLLQSFCSHSVNTFLCMCCRSWRRNPASEFEVRSSSVPLFQARFHLELLSKFSWPLFSRHSCPVFCVHPIYRHVVLFYDNYIISYIWAYFLG